MTGGGTGRWWCEHAWLGGDGTERDVLVEVEGGRITSVTPGTPRPAQASVLRGLVLPGLANAHSHAFHRALRGRSQRSGGTFWTWRDGMYLLADRLDPDRYLRLATAVYGEMALAGVTAVGEFHYVHHGRGGRSYDSPSEMPAALVEAAFRAGIRLTLLDTCYLRGGLGPDGAALPLDGAQVRFSDRTVDAWAERAAVVARAVTTEDVVVGAAVHSVRAVHPDDAAVVAAWARDRQVPLHVHLSEQPAENAACVAAYGASPAEVLADRGAWAWNSAAVHATHLGDRDLRLLAGSGTRVVMCPTTERDLADGVGRATRFRDAGCRVALGSDSHAVVDLFEEARAVELDERLVSGRRGHLSSADLLTAATEHGHRGLGWSDAGRIARGARADLVAVDLSSVRTAGCPPSPETLVFAATAADVTDVVVGGRPVVVDRRHLALDDVPGLLAASIEELWR